MFETAHAAPAAAPCVTPSTACLPGCLRSPGARGKPLTGASSTVRSSWPSLHGVEQCMRVNARTSVSWRDHSWAARAHHHAGAARPATSSSGTASRRGACERPPLPPSARPFLGLPPRRLRSSSRGVSKQAPQRSQHCSRAAAAPLAARWSPGPVAVSIEQGGAPHLITKMQRCALACTRVALWASVRQTLQPNPHTRSQTRLPQLRFVPAPRRRYLQLTWF